LPGTPKNNGTGAAAKHDAATSGGIVTRRLVLIIASCAVLAAAAAARGQDETEKAVEKYRQMLKEDPWSNPALLDADRGEALWKTPGGPNRVSL
jgi:sulfur-oxidizing protein SoxA